MIGRIGYFKPNSQNPSFRARALPFALLHKGSARDTESRFGSAYLVGKAGFQIKGQHFAAAKYVLFCNTVMRVELAWKACFNKTELGSIAIMTTGIKKAVAIILWLLWCTVGITFDVHLATADQTGLKRASVFTGGCRFQFVEGFFPCDPKVIWLELDNGRAVLVFTKDHTQFLISSGRDRQPNLENYFMAIDTFRLLENGVESAVDQGMEGECHFKNNRTATKFFSIKCDIYDRAKGTSYNFYLEKITGFKKDELKTASVLRKKQKLGQRPITSPLSDQLIEIPLESQGGTFVVPVTINDEIKLKFTVDSGAADVSIPADVVSTLMRTGSLLPADFTGEQKHRLADGSVVPSQTFTIRTLKVGDHILKNVTASVASVNGTLLLGQSFLGRFNSWSIDNTKHVLVLRD